MKIRRIFHHFEDCEEYSLGMWRICSAEEKKWYAPMAADLMRDPDQFYIAMMMAVEQWPVSCEANLSHKATNRRAWLGHAGCFLKLESPEECTRAGWHLLREQEQILANKIASLAIAEWEKLHIEKLKRLSNVIGKGAWEIDDAESKPQPDCFYGY